MTILELIKRLICPPKCICCKEVFEIKSNDVLCVKCLDVLASGVADHKKELTLSPIYVDKCVGYYHYSVPKVRKIVAHAKYVASKEFLNYIGKIAKESIDTHFGMDKIDIITFSPRKKKKVNIYGFDQAEELAKTISDVANIPCQKLISRTGKAKEQKRLNTEQRKKNVIGIFSCNENLKGKSILLIDDVITSGSTVNECAKMLKINGAKTVYVWSIAQ